MAGAGLSAMAGHEVWATLGSCEPGTLVAVAITPADVPAAGAVALALLASWGVLLVTRGRVRRAAALLTALVSLGQLVAVLTGVRAARDQLHDALAASGAECAVQLTGWFWVAVVALPFAVVPAVAAVLLVPSWPEMGRRYDAPNAPTEAAKTLPEEQENLDLWKAMDEGRDPTARDPQQPE
jgi:uncharacterized membrane protein (TIGR02234 family)